MKLYGTSWSEFFFVNKTKNNKWLIQAVWSQGKQKTSQSNPLRFWNVFNSTRSIPLPLAEKHIQKVNVSSLKLFLVVNFLTLKAHWHHHVKHFTCIMCFILYEESIKRWKMKDVRWYIKSSRGFCRRARKLSL